MQSVLNSTVYGSQNKRVEQLQQKPSDPKSEICTTWLTKKKFAKSSLDLIMKKIIQIKIKSVLCP